MRNPFRRSDSYSYGSRAKATAEWKAGTPARSAGHWRNLTKNARKGQAWEDRQRDFGS